MSQIKWPEEWAQDEGWPYLHGSEAPMTGEPRLWSSLGNILRKKGVRIADLRKSLGGPDVYLIEDLDFAILNEQILKYYKANGTRPGQRSGPYWIKVGAKLRRKGFSLANLCDALGLPSRSLGLTLPTIKKALRDYAKKYGSRPPTTQQPWRSYKNWLYQRDLSFAKVCDQLKIPGAENRKRTVASIRREILVFHKKYKMRPQLSSHQKAHWSRWRAHNEWLRRTNSTSIKKLCDELGLP